MRDVEVLLAERLDRHLSERDFEQGCRLACGFDGDDRSHHIAADLAEQIRAHLATLLEGAREDVARALLERAQAACAYDDLTEWARGEWRKDADAALAVVRDALGREGVAGDAGAALLGSGAPRMAPSATASPVGPQNPDGGSL